MANPSWSLDNSSFTSLPVQRRYGGRTQSTRMRNVVHETNSGVRNVYNRFQRYSYEFTFRCTVTELAYFQALHDAVGGEVSPFYYSISGAGAADSIHVFKEPDFDPVELDTAKVGGVRLFDYTLILQTAIVAA